MGELFKSRKKTRAVQTTELDPFVRALNQFLAGGIQSAFPETGAPAGPFAELVSPERTLAAGKRAFETFTVPSLTSSFTASGLGRSGALGEAISKAGVAQELPLLQEARNFAMNLLGLVPSVRGDVTQRGTTSTTSREAIGPALLQALGMAAGAAIGGPAGAAAGGALGGAAGGGAGSNPLAGYTFSNPTSRFGRLPFPGSTYQPFMMGG